ncbi:hypothetical protein [Geomonas subterranea]|uniref:hypothetical protein n=1 Tax=Geomonas subterranea TaxID=2847989 RepID=UPI001CD66CCD|nr:hypothetical protein [Geomonas fuzhouensis]
MTKTRLLLEHDLKLPVYCILLLMMSMFLFGCTSRITDFTILSTKSMDLSRSAEFVRTEKRVEGEDTKYIIVIIPTGIPNVKESVDRAIENEPGAVALLDGVIEHEAFYFPYIFGFETFRAKGTPLTDPKRMASKSTDKTAK